MSSGNGHHGLITFTEPPARVVSLVPSMTESIYDLGAGEYLVGATEFCPIPKMDQQRVSLVGGTKSIDTEAIVALKPNLIIANQEENTQEAVETLEGAGLDVWVTFPTTVDSAIEILWTLVRLFRIEQGPSKVKTLEVTLAWARESLFEFSPVRYFCPIWQAEESEDRSWWMTFNRQTFAHDLLQICGGENVFAERQRLYPLAADLGQGSPKSNPDRDTRYPRVTRDEILESDPRMILLPSEPFAFEESDRENFFELFAGSTAARDERILLIDGSLITWHGTRIARALAEIPSYFQASLMP